MATERADHPNCTSSLLLGVENRVPNQCWSSVGLVHSGLAPGVARSLPVSYEPRQ